MFDQMTREQAFELRALLLDCMSTTAAAVHLLYKAGADNLRHYDMQMEFSSLFNSIDPMAATA